jgi:hypothetical protein
MGYLMGKSSIMEMPYKMYYRKLVMGSLFILGVFFLWLLVNAPDLAGAATAVLFTITLGIWIGVSMPGISFCFFCLMTSSCLMGYGLLVRKRYALMMFWSGLTLFFLAGMMGLGTRY